MAFLDHRVCDEGAINLLLSLSTCAAWQKGRVPDDAVDTLASSLGRKEADPEDGKPVADQTKVMAAQSSRQKLSFIIIPFLLQYVSQQ